MEPEPLPGLNWHKIYDSVEKAELDIKLYRSRKIEIENLEICLSRTADGFFAVQDYCPHLGESLSRGTCNYLSEVVCPWHSYRFSLLTGEETTNHGLQLKTYAVLVNDSGLFIAVPASAGQA